MDLNNEYPKSPREKLGGLIWVPRMMDKARAYRANSLGEYMYPCPMDQMMLDFLEQDKDAFADSVTSKSDEEFLAWLKAKVKAKSLEDRQAVNERIMSKEPDTPEKKDKFKKMRDEIDPTRSDVKTWAALIDLEEGH